MFECYGVILSVKECVGMALVKCPECEKDVSDTVSSCPHCGYKKELDINSSPLGKSKIGFITGPAFLFFALICGFLAYSYMTRANTTGLFIACAGILVFTTYGVLNFIGWRVAYCPYCGKEERLRRFAQTLKCGYCRKISVRKGENLEAVK